MANLKFNRDYYPAFGGFFINCLVMVKSADGINRARAFGDWASTPAEEKQVKARIEREIEKLRANGAEVTYA